MQVDLQAVNQSDLRECTSAYNVHQSRGQKENNRSLVKAVPVATALYPFHCRNSLQSPPFPCRGISAPLVLLNTTTALQCPQQQAKMKKNVSQAKLTQSLGSPQLPKASEWLPCSGAQKRQRKGKRATCKRKDKINAKWEGKISPLHKQINFPALFRDCAVRDG